MAQTLDIRPAGASDAGAIADIYNQALAERAATFETEARSESAMQAWIGEHDRRHPLLVADLPVRGPGLDVDRSVVAWASISEYRPRACYSGVGEFSIYVREGYRGQGIGQRLLRALVDEARRLGYWKLVSRVFPHNEASRRLVARCGFREVGVYEKHGKLEGRWLDTVIVERLIPENLD